MKRLLQIPLFIMALALIWGCKKGDNYPGGTVSPYISLLDVRNIYKGSDVVLQTSNMFGAQYVKGVVVSDADGGNIKPGQVAIQNFGRNSSLRGITLEFASGSTNLMMGDSVLVDLTGGTLTKENGTLIVKGLKNEAVEKLPGFTPIVPTPVTVGTLAGNFANYEGTLVRVSVEFTPAPEPGETFAGNKKLVVGTNAGIYMTTLPGASFANEEMPERAFLTGVPTYVSTDTGIVMGIAVRNIDDIEPINNVPVLAWQFGVPASTGVELLYPATTVFDGLASSGLSRGPGYNVSSLARGLSSNVPEIVATKEDAMTLGGYYQFDITVLSGYKLSLEQIQARLRRSAAGANKYRWYYSLNGIDFTAIGPEDISFTSTADGVDQPPVVLSNIDDLKNIPAGSTVTFRLYGWGFSNVNAGSFAIGRYSAGDNTNSLVVTGNVSAL